MDGALFLFFSFKGAEGVEEVKQFKEARKLGTVGGQEAALFMEFVTV